MVIFCPGCGAKISAEPTTPGGDVECPRCHSRFSTAGIKSAADAPPPKRFRPKKAGRGKLAGVLIALAVLLVLAGGAAAVLYFTGAFGRWFGTSGNVTGGSAGPVQPTWQEYANAEGRFRVLFPGTPTRDTIPSPSKLKPGAKPKVVSFTVETPDAVYSVAYEDFDAKERLPEQFVENQRAELSAGRGGKLVTEKDVTAGTHKGKEFVVEVPGRGTAYLRFFADGRRLYKVMAVGAGGKAPDPAAVAKVFDSFQITG
ncbi:MAG TPA: hypothetical protein VGF55_16875 [Gemmataceae bacterium]